MNHIIDHTMGSNINNPINNTINDVTNNTANNAANNAANHTVINTLKVHHIGYLAKKMEAAINAFQHLGYTIRQDTVHDAIRRIHICFMEKDGYVIELVSPADNESLVSGLLKKYKNSPYHICYETQDLNQELALLTAEGYTAIDTPTPAPALGNRRVVFLMNPFLGMIELLEM